MTKFRTMGVTHDTSGKKTHNLLSHIFAFKEGSNNVIQALHILSLAILKPRGNSFILRLSFCLTHFRSEFLSSAHESIIRFQGK